MYKEEDMMKKTFVYLLVVTLVLSDFLLSVSGNKSVENISHFQAWHTKSMTFKVECER
jgi:hypothetical protein